MSRARREVIFGDTYEAATAARIAIAQVIGEAKVPDRTSSGSGKRQEAQDLLAAVYHWFIEGFDPADLTDAKALLEELI